MLLRFRSFIVLEGLVKRLCLCKSVLGKGESSIVMRASVSFSGDCSHIPGEKINVAGVALHSKTPSAAILSIGHEGVTCGDHDEDDQRDLF